MIEERLAEHYTTVPADSDAEQHILAAVLAEARPRRNWQRRVAVCGAAAIIVTVAVFATMLAEHHRDSAPARPAVGSALFGVTWLDRAANVTLVFTAHTVHRADGCFGSTNAVTIDAARLHVGRSLPPSYVCGGAGAGVGPPDPAMQRQAAAEHLLYQILGREPRWSVTGSTLTLTDARGRSVQLTDKGTAPLSLPGSRWVSIEVRGPHGVAAGPHYHSTLTFDTDGTFRARDMCRAIYTGSYRAGASRLQLSEVHSSPFQACLDPHLPSIVLPALRQGGTVTYRIEHNLLYLTQKGVTRSIELRPAR